MDKPILTFEQWSTIFKLWTPLEIKFFQGQELQDRFSAVWHKLYDYKLASAEHNTYKEIAEVARYWLSTHYISDDSPRYDARRYWNLWKHTYGPRLEKVYSSGWHEECLERPGYIYVLKMDKWYKIGRTKNVMRRFPQIRVKMPRPTRLWSVFFVTNMYDEEKILHEYYAPFHTNGEWFELPYEVACSLHSNQPDGAIRVYARYKHMHPQWRLDRWQEWQTFYDSYLKRDKAKYAQRINQQ